MVLRHELSTLMYIFLASILCMFTIIWLHQPHPPTSVHLATTALFPTDTPTPTPSPQVTMSSQTSSDGIKELRLKDDGSTFSFTLTDTTTHVGSVIFFQKSGDVSAMSIPFNTFSPANTYFFLQETLNGQTHFLVFNTSGEDFANGQKYLDVTSLFSAFTSDYTISDVTGWGSDSFLYINVKARQGDGKVTYGLDLPSQNFYSVGIYFP